jgi:signal transduction histidine kinase
MVSILGFSELLLHRDFDERRRRDLLGTIHRQTGLLVKMVGELLDLARIESRQGRDFVRRVLPLRPLLERTAGALMMQDDPRRVQFEAGAQEHWVDADEDKLQLAVTNVLGNAFKYSRGRGEVRLDLVTGQRAGRDEVGIRVRDEGVGMDAEQVARVFERFWRADTSGNVPGTGLGMSITKEVVELHGGRVAIDSVAGRGTTVTVWLPRYAAPADAADPSLSAAADRPCAAVPAASPIPPG